MTIRMRSRSVHCERCNGECKIIVNIDRGEVVDANIAKQCQWPKICTDNFVRGVFDHRWCDGIVRKVMTC